MADEELDDLSRFEAKETSHRIPGGYLVLYFGLIAWGIWYLWAYSPWGSGWSQAKDLQGAVSSGTTVFWTVAFTAIPALAALLIVLAQKNWKKG